MDFSGIDALLVTNPVNIRYLTGFAGTGSGERESYLILTPGRKILCTGLLYRTAATQLTSVDRVADLTRETPLSRRLTEICAEERVRSLGFEVTDLTVAEHDTLTKNVPDVRFVATKDRVERERMIKRRDELAHIKTAASVTDQCFSFVRKRIRSGVTEARLAWDIEGFLRYKAGGIAFAPIVAFNANAALPHYDGRGTLPLRKSSLILMDFGARVNGYCADMTRVVFLGPPNDERKKAYDAVLSANRKTLELLQGGERHGATLDAAAREVLAEAGFPAYPHGLGHAVGLAIHESPRLSVNADEVLTEGMAVTVEPGIYREGEFGIRIEDLVYIAGKRVDSISESPKDLTVL